jgi:PAS domain S-box-containing protein
MHVSARAATSSSRFAGRYEIVGTFKQGRGTTTYLARDGEDGDAHVVLKVFERDLLDAAARERFGHETKVLATLSGLGLARLRDAGRTDQHLYLTQTYVPGETLEAALTRGPLPLRVVLRLGIEVAGALEIAHGARILHRDVKPANILLTGFRRREDALDTVTLVDFGLAHSPLLDEALREDLVGTVRYLAPEAAGSLASPADERSDLYSLGVVLYECVAGTPPFPGPTVSDLLHQHLSATPADLHAVAADLPRALAAAIGRLLRKDPTERYQSAAALMADLQQILDAVDRGDRDPGVVIGRHDLRSSLTDPGFVGRDAELARLAAVVEDVAGGRSRLVLLEADSGGGKTRLLGEAAGQAAGAGLTVVRGQGVALSAQRPFALLHGVGEDLARLLRSDEPRRQALIAALGDLAADVVRALPALGPVLDTDAGPVAGPEQFGELRSLAALRTLLSSLATEEHPLLVVLDDCQWADTLTIRLLGEIFDATRRRRYLGVIAAFRSEEVPVDHPLRGIAAGRRVRLGPLDADAVVLLAESMAGPLPDAALETVVRLADGNPFMAAAVLRGLAESGAMVAGTDGWLVDESRLSDAQAARRAAAFLVRRLELLDEDALELLSVGAVLGKQFDIAVATEVAGAVAGPTGGASVRTILAEARRRRLVWVDDDGAHCTFFHDKIREALLARLSDEQGQRLHSRAADVLLARYASAGPRRDELVFDLAYHLDAAGRGADALPFALAAARLARGRFALDAAVAHYDMAARAVDDPAARREIAEGLGDVLMLQGNYAAAEEQFRLARSLAADNQQAADLDSKLGALAFKQGDIATAKTELEQALRVLGRRLPRRGTLLLALLWELLVQVAHSVLPRLTTDRRRRVGPRADRDFLAMRIYSRLAYMYWFRSGRANCAWAHLRGMNLAERYEPSAELGQSYSEHAPVMTMLPWYTRGVRYAQRSLQVRRDLGDLWGQGQSLNFTGVVCYAGSRYEEALEALDESVRLLGRTGDQWEVNTAQWNRALCLLRLGRLADAVDVARDTHQAAQAIGDRTAAGIALSIWARASDGRVSAELIRALLDRGGDDAQTTAELHLAAALTHRRAGRLAEAGDCVDDAVRTVRTAGLRQEYIAPVFAWQATIRRELVMAAPRYDVAVRRRRLRAARRAVRRARWWAACYRNNAPHVLREAGLVAALAGRPRTATRLLERSLTVANRQHAAHEAILTTLATTELPSSAPAEDVELQRLTAQTALDAMLPEALTGADEQSGTSRLSVFDRVNLLIDAARTIIAATTPAAVDSAVVEAATALLHAERAELVPAAGPIDSGYAPASRSLMQRAVAAGEPVVDLDAPGAEANDSLVLSGVRCAMAAPIVVGGEAVSCLYVIHRQLGEVFGVEETQLAGFIVTLAGAAYEHLAGSEARFRSLVQSSSDVITLVDAEGMVTYQSPAVEHVLGARLPGIVGQRADRWVHRDDRARFWQCLARAADEPFSQFEMRVRHADGTFRTVETVATDLRSEPAVGAIVLNTRDITDRKLAESELRRKNTELERVSRAKDTFLASMSHELRTPLNAVIGFTGTLLMQLPGPLTDDQDRQLRIVERNAKHLLTIINDMLDLAKIESGEMHVEISEVRVDEVVRSVVQTLQPLASEKELALDTALPSGAVLLRSDARALQQILLNLVSNAIKFTERGGVRVRLAVSPAAATLTVADTGVGISEDDLGRIFDAFDRGSDARRSSKEGTGLGLHISRRLAELIGAELSARSEVGRGSTFTLRIPTRRVGDAGGGRSSAAEVSG